MTDTVDRQTRSRIMSRIKSSNTKPEIRLRKALHSKGFRYHINDRKLPVSPDIVLPKWKVAIMVHGCFWHRHQGCPKSTMPSTNVEFWERKFNSNVHRDATSIEKLRKAGWRTLVVWECAIGKIVEDKVLDRENGALQNGLF